LYEYLKKKCAASSSSEQQHLSTGQLMFASSLSKLIASFVAYPHEIVRSRLQDAGHARRLHQQSSNSNTNFREYKNVRDAVKTIANEEGIRGFYRGIIPALLRTVPAAVLTLLSYEKIKDFLDDNYGKTSVKQ
jgi:solute carrier family 25 folate transporter 32